jgi:hypothetical protein
VPTLPASGSALLPPPVLGHTVHAFLRPYERTFPCLRLSLTCCPLNAEVCRPYTPLRSDFVPANGGAKDEQPILSPPPLYFGQQHLLTVTRPFFIPTSSIDHL